LVLFFEEGEQATANADPYGMTTKEQATASANADPCGMTTKRTDNGKDQS
jgi:hypothetical protein